MIRRLLSLGIRAEVLQATFAAGVIVGFLAMAVLITVPKIAGILIVKALH